jgi:hypothetical protein
MTLEEAIQSVVTLDPEGLLDKPTAQAVSLLAIAAAHPVKVPDTQRAYAVEWALWSRAQAMLLDLVLAKRMTIFPQEDGSLKFGGRLLKPEEVQRADHN